MKKLSPVYSLIKSLTMSEKRYFKIFSERHTIGKQNKYVALFDQLDGLEIDDDKKIKAGLKELGISCDFLAADKNYLFNMILRSLNDFHHARTYNLDIKENLISIEILFHKGLYRECLQLISKTSAVAQECENFQLMIDLLMWKKKCTGYSIGLKQAAAINLQIDQFILLINNLKAITDIYYESYQLFTNQEELPPDELLRKFNLLLKKPELKSEDRALSFSSKVYFYLIYANFYYVKDEKLLELECLQKLVNMLNASAIYPIENPLDYISVYNRLLSIKKFFPSSSFFDDIKLLKDFSKKIQIRKEVVAERVFVHINTHTLEYYLLNNDFQEALQKTAEIEREIARLSFDIESYHMIYFYYLQVTALIYVGQFHKALKLINKILMEFLPESRPQVFLRIEILNCLVHYELKNYELSLLLSKKLLKKKEALQVFIPLEIEILKAFVLLCDKPEPAYKVENAVFQKLLNEINNQSGQFGSTSKGLIENYKKWIAAKIKRKLVCELF